MNKNFLDKVIDGLDRFELSWVTLLTKILPLVIPLPTAIQTKSHVMTHLSFTPLQGWIVAGIVELFGYASLYKALQFAEHNRKYTSDKNQAPFKFAILIYLFYLAIVITFNVIPELATNKPGYIIAMNILMALLSVPGGALAGISAIHTERKEALKRPTSGSVTTETTSETYPKIKITKPTSESSFRSPVPVSEMGFRTNPTSRSTFKTGRPSIHQETVYSYMEQVLSEQGRTASYAEVARDLNLPQSTASRLRNAWIDKKESGNV